MNGERRMPGVETTRRVVSTPGNDPPHVPGYLVSDWTDDEMRHFRGRRVDSPRLPRWDYQGNAAYFVTIVTRRRCRLLSDVIDGRVLLTDAGAIIQEEWCRTPDVREYVYLDAFVVMPDHLHGVIGLRGRHPLKRAVGDESGVDTTRWVVSTPDWRRSTLLPDSLGSILGQFKSKCTKRIRPFLPDFGWQANYYEHIIRDEDDLNRIRAYIVENPLKWDVGEDVPENLWM